MRRVTLISTGGTIEKTYDERSGVLENRHSIVQRMLRRLRLNDTHIATVELMSKDSLYMTDADRETIVAAVRVALRMPGDQASHGMPTADAAAAAHHHSGVVVLHGTDTLHLTGERLHRDLVAQGGGVAVPVVLTGAMRPFDMKQSDALQNLTEAVFASGVLPPGVWCVAHGRALAFPGVVKDRDLGTFVRARPGSPD